MRAGHELPLLLLAAFRAGIDDLHAELADAGHPGVRPVHGFALQALGADAISTAELGRRLGVSKQAAAKTAVGLEALGYVAREPDPSDARVRLLRTTPRGRDCLATSAEILDRRHARLATELGPDRLTALESDLAHLAGTPTTPRPGDLPGWLGG